MHHQPGRNLRRAAAATTPIFVFAGIVALSVGFFFLFTLPRWSRKDQTAAPAGPASASSAAGTEPVAKPAAPPVSKPAKNPKALAFYAAPENLLAAILEPLKLGNLDAAMKIAGKTQGQTAQANFLRHILTKAGYRVADDPKGPWARLAQTGQTQRYTLAINAAVPGTPPPAGLPWFDLDRDKTQGWKVSQIGHPDALIRQVTEALRSSAIIIDEKEVRTPADPVSQATDFLSGILRHDFKSARAMTNEAKVTHEKLAGLCIVFEEGEYKLVADRPVFVTSERGDTATALLKVHSDKLGSDSEMGVVMRKIEGRGWMIEDLNFDSLLNSYVQATDAGNVFYTPVNSSPQGGDSLILYFEFDRAEITPRARRQLGIVADLLKSDPVRKLRISGHSDALGSDNYNLHLSQDRARAVAAGLKELGVAPDQVITVGFGATSPLDPNKRKDGQDNPEGRSRNRRTEVFLDFSK